VGPRAGLDTEDREKILSPLPGIEYYLTVLLSIEFFNCANLGFHGYINFLGYCGSNMRPNIRPIVPQAWIPLSHENGLFSMLPNFTLHAFTLTGASFVSTPEV
jgi:hypothetical protein